MDYTPRIEMMSPAQYLAYPKGNEQEASGRADRRPYKSFVPESLGIPVLGELPDGSRRRYNGNGRISEFTIRYEQGLPGLDAQKDRIPVQVISIRSEEHSRAVWLASNHTAKTTANQEGKARLATGENLAKAAEKAAANAGYKFTGSAREPKQVTQKVGEAIYKSGRSAQIYYVLDCVEKANWSAVAPVIIDALTLKGARDDVVWNLAHLLAKDLKIPGDVSGGALTKQTANAISLLIASRLP